MRLYIHLNREKSSDVSEIIHLLPNKRKGRRGKEAGMSSREAKERDIRGNNLDSSWDWPERTPTEREKRKLVAICLEIGINFFFNNFGYTFGGENFLQGFGGPIGSRLTMAVARLIMQSWYDEFTKILKENNIEEKLKGIYVDDGRGIMTKLPLGTRYQKGEGFVHKDEWQQEDVEKGENREKLTEREVGRLMNEINPDLEFTTESERDFDNGRLPTLSFEMWSTANGIEHSYYEKPMRLQVLTMKRS